ncbi:hypothetical protein [Cohnella silvisoli]|uniref:ABC transmembrane type-1 domain-containing protein n=1 Tax=Cohnella silvisoli TaxID=2873699 RepID=A0ABV1KRG2_9BACL|nr:hypothetical protein [Cohnella silvisoli]MCD9024557.1 hypothetical protein [Cohnella silvisoli]
MVKSSLSLSHRLWKYKLHYVIVIPALILILAFKIIPFVLNVHMAFTDFIPARGLWDSSWVGMDNFRLLFENVDFRRVLANTLIIKLSYVVFTGLVALGLSLALSSIRSEKLRNSFSTLFLIPFFIPSLVFAFVVMNILSPSLAPIFPVRSLFLGDTELFRPVIVIVETIKTCGIPILVALAAIGVKQAEQSYLLRNVLPAIRAIAAFMILQLSTILSMDFELLHQLNNPLVYLVGDTLNTYQFRIGLMQADYSASAAISLLQFCVQVVFTLLAYVIVRSFFLRDLFSAARDNSPLKTEKRNTSNTGLPALILYSLIVLLPLYMLFVYPFLSKSSTPFALGDLFSAGNFIIYFIVYFVTVCISLLLTLTLAYPLTVRDLPGRNLYKAFLLLVAVMGGGNIAEYLLVKELGMMDTVYSQMVFGFFPIVGVFVIKSIFNSRCGVLKEKAALDGRSELWMFFNLFIPKVWKPLVALGILQFASLWGSFYSSLIFMNSPEHFSPAARLLSVFYVDKESGVGELSLYAGIVSLPPIVLFLVFRRFLTSEVLLSQIRKL